MVNCKSEHATHRTLYYQKHENPEGQLLHLISSARPIVNPGTFLMGFTNCNLTLRTFKGGTVKNIAKGTTDTRVEFSLSK